MPAYVVLTALPHHLAGVVAGALEAEGIRVRLDRPPMGSIYGLDTGQFATRVLVHPDDLVRAQALIDEVESGED